MRKLAFAATIAAACHFGFSAPAIAGAGCHAQDQAVAKKVKRAEVDLKLNCMTPTVVHIDAGTTVVWTNRDEIEHLVVGTGWGVGDALKNGEAVSYRFDSAGIFPYTCYLHPGMNGAVVVGADDVPDTAGITSSIRRGSGAEVPSKRQPAEQVEPLRNRPNDVPLPGAAAGVGLVSAAAGYGVGSIRRKRQLA